MMLARSVLVVRRQLLSVNRLARPGSLHQRRRWLKYSPANAVAHSWRGAEYVDRGALCSSSSRREATRTAASAHVSHMLHGVLLQPASAVKV